MNINQPSAKQLETLYPERNYMDIKRQYPFANQTYYQLSADKKMYRTIFLKINPFNGNKIQPMMSNFVVGVPPDGMKELDPKLINAIGRTNAMVSTSFW